MNNKKLNGVRKFIRSISWIMIPVSVFLGFGLLIYGITLTGRHLKSVSECGQYLESVDTDKEAVDSKYKRWNFLTEGTVVEVEYIVKPTTFGPDIKETILKFDDDRVYVIHNALASVVLNKRIRIYQFNYYVSYEVIE